MRTSPLFNLIDCVLSERFFPPKRNKAVLPIDIDTTEDWKKAELFS